MAEERRRGLNLTPPPSRQPNTLERRAERRSRQAAAQENQPGFLSDPMFSRENLMDAATFVAESTPIIGDALAAKEVWDELQKEDPNYYLAGALGGAAIIGLIPGIGDAAAQAIRTGARRGLDFARRIEVDPTALGSTGGNLRLRPREEPQVNRQVSNEEYSATWDRFDQENTTPEDWQDSVRQYVSESRDVDPVVRTPELEQSTRDLLEGRITREEHLRNVDEYKPVNPWDQLPREPSDTATVFSLKPNQRAEGNFILPEESAERLGVRRSTLQVGDRFNGRLDIPAYNTYDTWIVAGTSPASSGSHYAKAIQYGSEDGRPVRFLASNRTSERIGSGEIGKTGYATVSGVIQDLDADAIRARAAELLDDPEWTQVGFDPRRQGGFYVRAGENRHVPVREADEVIQIGPLVLAKNARLDPEYQGYSEGGLAVEESLVPTPRPSQQEREDRQTQRALGEEFGNIEFEADLYSKGFLDPVSRLGLDADVAKTVPVRSRYAGLYARNLGNLSSDAQRYRDAAGYTDQIEQGDVLTLGDYSGSNTVWSHEFRHRGLDKIREYFENSENFINEYLPDSSEETRQVADAIFSLNARGAYDEAFTDFADRNVPKEEGFNLDLLQDEYKSLREVDPEAYAEIESALNTAARDILTEQGSPLPAEMQEREEKEEKGWLSNFISNLFGREQGFAKGGMAMEEQMNEILKEEGGLTDDGMDKDPVSGNDVPPGSMASEVRDDIDARLSGGEYVVPADVVRYYGVKFFEDLRGEAKQGLNHMEETGRIGGEPVEMAKGGSVRGYFPGGSVLGAATSTIANNLQQGLTATGQQQNTTSVPNTPSYVNEDGTVNFDQLVGQSAQNMYLQTPYSSLADLFADFSQVGGYTQRMREGRPAPGSPGGMLEYRTYVGPNGELLQIPFLNGQPQAEIPEGYTPQGATSVEETVETPQVQAPPTPSGDGDNSDSRVESGPSFVEQAQEAYDKFSSSEDVLADITTNIGETPLPGGLGLIGGGINTIETLTDVAQARGYALSIAESNPELSSQILDTVDEAIDSANFGVRALEGLLASGKRYEAAFREIAEEGGVTPPPATVVGSTRGVAPPSAAGSTKPPKESTPTFTPGEITYGGKPSDPNKGGQSDTGGGMGVDYGGGTGGSGKGTSGSSSGKSTSSSSSGKSSSSSSGKSSSSSSGKSNSSSSSKSQPEDRGFGKAEGGLMTKPTPKTRTKRTTKK